jgi:hypothetical protein
MPLLWMVVLVAFIAMSTLDNINRNAEERAQRADVSTITISMLVYRNAVAEYASSNPAFIGVVSDALLNLPVWYIKPPNLSNYISSGKSYSFYTTPLPGLSGELASRTESINVGINQHGVLLAPNMANSGIVLPAQIPLGSVVLIQ